MKILNVNTYKPRVLKNGEIKYTQVIRFAYDDGLRLPRAVLHLALELIDDFEPQIIKVNKYEINKVKKHVKIDYRVKSMPMVDFEYIFRDILQLKERMKAEEGKKLFTEQYGTGKCKFYPDDASYISHVIIPQYETSTLFYLEDGIPPHLVHSYVLSVSDNQYKWLSFDSDNREINVEGFSWFDKIKDWLDTLLKKIKLRK